MKATKHVNRLFYGIVSLGISSGFMIYIRWVLEGGDKARILVPIAFLAAFLIYVVGAFIEFIVANGFKEENKL